MTGFTHLHNHSHYSLLDGLPQIDDLVNNAQKKGFTALALTDHGVMYGAVEFYKKCLSTGIKPIIGMEAYLAIGAITDKTADVDNDYFHLVLLAKNYEGYKNLLKLSTIAHLEGFYYKPKIDKTILKKHSQGLLGLSGCMRGDIPRALMSSDITLAEKLLNEYLELFNGDFYLEIQRHTSSDVEYANKERQLNERLIALSKKTGVRLVATNDSHYLDREDSIAQDLLLCVGMGKTVQDTNRLDMRHCNLSLMPGQSMEELFADLPEALETAKEISEKCDIQIALNQRFFPDFAVPDGFNSNTYLTKIAHDGIKEKLRKSKGLDDSDVVPKEIVERLDYELGVIINKNYSGYFLVVADFVNWARANGIIATTRGSAAGSLVSYAIGITTVNPLDYKLPFERFLNPMRPSPPDIDMDFADNRRDEVIAYVTEKYGKDKVAQIVTFGTMMARAAVRDMGRALGIPYAKCDRIAKMIPFGKQGFPMTIEKALTQSQELKDAYDKDPETKQLIELSMKVEGAARHASVHAAGIVIAPNPLTEYTPLQLDQDGKTITQYDMHSCEDVGLVKMDFLGIRNLSILGNAVEIVKHTKGDEVDLGHIPLDDRKTYKLLAAGKTMGMFQLGGSGMTRYLKELSPSNIFDIMAMISLYRPGPMESIPEFIRRKHNPKMIAYPDQKMKDILSMSYGIITYQDDVLLIAINIAGYTWEEADKLRKAMGKKIPKEMAAQKEKFIQGCIDNSGYDEQKSENLWKLIEPFAAYGFNKAHAASYAIVAYQTAYMKANYPVEFMAAFMTAEAGDPATISDAVEECKSMGISILPPDINESLANFTVIDETKIRFGLNAIKNLGTDVIDTVIKKRKEYGKYLDIQDFVQKTQTRSFNKKSWEALVKSGALDQFGERGLLIANSDIILDFSRQHFKASESAQNSLFKTQQLPKTVLKLRQVEPATKKEILSWEKELLGLYVTAHPLDDYKEVLSKYSHPIRDIAQSRGQVSLVAIISKVQKILTKKGDQMAFLDIEDQTGMVETVVFPSVFQKVQHLMVPDKIVVVTGKNSDKDGVPKLLADDIKDINEFLAGKKISQPVQNAVPSEIKINIPSNANEQVFSDLKILFESSPGERPVALVIDGQIIKTPFKINPTDELKVRIKSLLS